MQSNTNEMVMPTSTNKFEDFEKCGEITTAIGVGQKVFALNCMFCGTICLQLETFALHIEEHHQRELNARFYENVELAEDDIKIEIISEIPNNDDVIEVDEDHDIKTKNSIPIEDADISIVEEEDPLSEAQHDISSILSVEIERAYFSKSDDDVELGDASNDNTNIVPDNIENESDSDDMQNDDYIETDNKELITAIIEEYKKLPLLWNEKERVSGKRKKNAYKQITNTIKQEMGLQYHWTTIKKCIFKMRNEFRIELYRHKGVARRNSLRNKPLWYYEQLSFLNASIRSEVPLRSRIRMDKLESALPLLDLTESQNLQLIEIYETFPSLWDEQQIEFRLKNQREGALNKMLETVNHEMDLDLTAEELQKKLSLIRLAGTQEKRLILECKRLKKNYKPFCKYYDKIAFLHDHVGPFWCDLCGAICLTPDAYKVHKSQHDGTMPFVCPICNRGFKQVGNCITHIRRHNRDYTYECDICNKRFATSTDVKVHKRQHTGEKPYFCEICGQSFRTWTFFFHHTRRHEKRPTHKCTICSKGFYNKTTMTEHMNGHLNVRDKVCNECGKAFTTSKYLRQHKQIHAEKKQYVCKICNKEFAQYAGLSGHMKSHGTTVSGVLAEEQHS